MTRDELIKAMSLAIAAYFGENDHPADAAKAALAAIEAAGFKIVRQNHSISAQDKELIENLRMSAETERWRAGGIPIEETEPWQAADRIEALLAIAQDHP
jgi:hypothetical protein